MTREMKNSGVQWIGDIPSNWSMSKFKVVGNVLSGYPFNSENFTSDIGVPLIRIRDITSGQISTYYNGEYPSNYLVYNGDFLVGMDGDFNVRWWQGGAALLNQRCCKLTLRKNYCAKYVYYLLPFGLKLINELAYSTTVKHLSVPDILNLNLLQPPLAEQKAIANFLDTKCEEIDALLQDLDAEVKTLAEYKKSIIAETVTKGLNHNVPMKSSGISWVGDIPSHWSVRRVKDCYRFETGFTPDTTNQTYYDDIDGEDWACISDLQSKYVFETKSKISQSYLRINRKSKVQQGSLLFSFKLSVGTVAFAGKDIFTNEAIAAFQPSPNVNLQFLYYSAPVYIIHNAATNIYGASILNSTRISNAYIIFPPLGEQKAIADYLDKKCAAIEQTITSKLQQIETLKAYKSSLIYEYVTGKKQVPV